MDELNINYDDADREVDEINELYDSGPAAPAPDNVMAVLDGEAKRLGNEELERSILNEIIYGGRGHIDFFTKLREDDFFGANNRSIFKILQDRFAARDEINPRTANDFVSLYANPKDAGRLAKDLISISTHVPLDTGIDTAIVLIKSLTKNRKLKSDIILKAGLMFDKGETADSIVEHISSVLMNLESGRKEKKVSEVTDNVVGQLLGEITIEKGLMLGSKELDDQFGGVKEDTYTTIGAESGAGKTAMVVDLIYRLGTMHKDKVAMLFFSMEMAEDRIMKRLISRDTGYSNQVMEARMKKLTPEQRDNIRRSGIRMRDIPLEIVYATLTPAAMNLRVRRFKLQNPGKRLIIFLDHIGLVTGTTDNIRVNTINASTAAKSWCVDYGASVFVLTQFTKEINSDENRKRWCIPDMRYIMESGRIRQDSDNIWLLWRPEIYTPVMKYDGKDYHTSNRMIILNQKNRDGFAPTHIHLRCDIGTNTLTDRDFEY